MLTDNDKLDMALQQANAAQGSNNSGLSNTPYYMQELSRQMDRIEFKLDKLRSELAKQ